MLKIVLEGKLNEAQLREKLSAIEDDLEAASLPVAMLVDCRAMNGYEVEAREFFVKWNRKWRPRIRRVAIITDKILWHMVITAMALASSQEMKPFKHEDDAQAWAERALR